MINYRSVVIMCSDIARSRAFYQDLFHLPVELDIGGLVTFACGISLWENECALDLLYPGVKDISPPEKPLQELYFETDNLPGFASLLKEKNIRLLHPVQVTPWNQQTIRFFDPDGNLIEVGESMEHVVMRLSGEGFSPSELSEKTMMPIEFIQHVLSDVKED